MLFVSVLSLHEPCFLLQRRNEGFWQQNFDAMLSTDRGVSTSSRTSDSLVAKRVREKYDNPVVSASPILWRANTTTPVLTKSQLQLCIQVFQPDRRC